MSGNYDKPTDWARPLDQGKAGTCTVFAVGNAACNHLMQQNIDVTQEFFIGGLLQKVPDTTGKLPTDLHGMEVKNMQNVKTGNYGNISMNIIQTFKQNKDAGHVLVYPTGGKNTHAVFMKKVSSNDKGQIYYECVNSWGNNEPYPEVILKKDGTRLFEVVATWTPINPQSGIQKHTSQPITGPVPASAKSLEYKCDACNVTTTDADGLRAHIKGRSHAKVIKNITLPEAKKPTTQFHQNSQIPSAEFQSLSLNDHLIPINPFYCSTCNTTMSSDFDMKNHIEGKQHKSKTKNSSTEENNPFHCRICDTTMPGEAAFDSHMKGKPHSKKMEAATAVSKSPPSEVKRLNYCELCDVQMPGPAALTDHFNGKPHAKKMKALV